MLWFRSCACSCWLAISACGAAVSKPDNRNDNANGEFLLLVDGHKSGSETFSIVSDATSLVVSYQNTMTMHAQQGATVGNGRMEYDRAWKIQRGKFTSQDATVSITSTLGGSPFSMRVVRMPSGLDGVMTPTKAFDVSLADDSVIQFSAFCAVTRQGQVRAFPAMRVVVSEQAAKGQRRRYAIDMEGRGIVQVLCSGVRLVGLIESTNHFEAIRVGDESEVTAIRQL
jgi:hypothetical protein